MQAILYLWHAGSVPDDSMHVWVWSGSAHRLMVDDEERAEWAWNEVQVKIIKRR